ncbi:retrovirus-related pol polyprotein from transposon TNT 1-94 [Tanacetum coccineum]
MNDFKRNKHFLEKIASNLKFLNNLQPEWSRHVTIVHQTKDFHIADYTQLYDFLKYNQKEVDELRAERLAKTQDPLALMANSNNSFKYPVFYPDLPLSRNQVVQNAVQNLGVQNVGNQNGVIVVSGIAHQNGSGNVVAAQAKVNANGNNGNQARCYNCRGLGHLARNCTVRPKRRDATYLQTQLLIAQKEEAGIQLQAEEFDLIAAAADLDEIEETDKAPIYDSDGSAKVQLHDNCYNDEIFNMFTQEEQYTKLLESIPEPHQVPQNDSNVVSEVSIVEQATEVEKVNSVNRKLRETNANLTTELVRYKIRERCFEISQEKYNKLERCYQQSVYQEQCLSKKINALHLSSVDESLAKHKALELEIEHLLRAVISYDIMSNVQNNSVVDTSNLQTELDQCKYDKISYDKAHNDMQQKIERLQAQLGDLKGKCKDTPCVLDTLDPLPQKLENENVELEFQNKLRDTIYENAKLRAQLFDKVSNQKDTSKGTSTNTNFANQSTERKPFLQSLRKPYAVPTLPNSTAFPKESLGSICKANRSKQLSNGENQVVTKSSAVTTADASDKCQQQQDSTSSTSTLATTISADGNFDL